MTNEAGGRGVGEILVAHDPARVVEAEALRERYRVALGALMLGCEHVGSTAVAGLVAKPILDLDLVIADYDAFPSVVAALAGKLGESDGPRTSWRGIRGGLGARCRVR